MSLIYFDSVYIISFCVAVFLCTVPMHTGGSYWHLAKARSHFFHLYPVWIQSWIIRIKRLKQGRFKHYCVSLVILYYSVAMCLHTANYLEMAHTVDMSHGLTMLISEIVSMLAMSKLMPTVTGPSGNKQTKQTENNGLNLQRHLLML